MEPSPDIAMLAGEGGTEPTFVEIAKNQPRYQTLPALCWQDGKVLTEWVLSEEERQRLIRGENLRLWIWCFPTVCERCGLSMAPKLQPVALDVTDEHHG